MKLIQEYDNFNDILNDMLHDEWLVEEKTTIKKIKIIYEEWRRLHNDN